MEPPSAIRWALLSAEQREDESLEKYLARLEKMVLDAYPNERDQEFHSSMFVEVFLKGCRDKTAVLSVCDKSPKSLEEAYTMVKSASTYRKTILGKKGGSSVKKIYSLGEESDSDSSSGSREVKVRRAYGKNNQEGNSQDRIQRMEAEIMGVKDSIGQVLTMLKDGQHPPSRQKGNGCFRCGDPTHFVKDCPIKSKDSPRQSPNRGDGKNWNSASAAGDGVSLRPAYQKGNQGYSPPSVNRKPISTPQGDPISQGIPSLNQ